MQNARQSVSIYVRISRMAQISFLMATIFSCHSFKTVSRKSDEEAHPLVKFLGSTEKRMSLRQRKQLSLLHQKGATI